MTLRVQNFERLLPLILAALLCLGGTASARTQTVTDTPEGAAAQEQAPDAGASAAGAAAGEGAADQERDDEASADDASADVTSEEESFDERLDKLLSEAAAEEVYGEKENCLYKRKYSHIDIVSEDILIFSRGGNYWINQLKHTCRGLERNMVIHTVFHGVNSLCSNDLVFANRRFDQNQGFTPSGRPIMIRATCTLGEFQSIAEPYAQALMELPQ